MDMYVVLSHSCELILPRHRYRLLILPHAPHMGPDPMTAAGCDHEGAGVSLVLVIQTK